ncbi:SUMF1/EgtB/PvdO family nonheme iron enzyme [Nitrospira sp. NS4]|uniref:SUMF1/EgtB/PvdO family nonheme iron enzyme n=1 Tax=Nitrospira sp. NS4 TaxID=3414498 RepID=UPI003C2B3113
MALTIGLLVIGLGSALAAERVGGVSEKPSGSGVIVDSDGYVLTASHVVANARRIVVVTYGEVRVPGVVVSIDVEHDLALLKIEIAGISTAPLGYAGSVKLDEEVVVVGFPFGLREVSVTRGRVAAVRTKGVRRVFQVDAAVNPGNSGGPVFNARGEVVGVIITKFSHPSGVISEGMAFAVPMSYATPLLANIESFDFTTLGKGRKRPKGPSGQNLVEALVRATVRIETVRGGDGAPPQAASPPEASGKSEAASARVPRGPVPRSHDSSVPLPDEAAVQKVNEELRRVQQNELEQLTQRGVRPPEQMVLIPAGEFLMGSEDGLADSRPMHRVYVSAYWFDKYAVTNRRYRQCVEAGACPFPKDRSSYDDTARGEHPVTNVTWSQARGYCRWLGRRLPTEAEWEKAARGTDGRLYPWGNSDEVFKARAKTVDQQLMKTGTDPVGTMDFAVSPYGVADLVGNVSEWVNDWYAEDYYRSAPARDPQGPVRGSFRVLRGGDSGDRSLELRASYRGWDDMTYWGPSLGFRCAEDLP